MHVNILRRGKIKKLQRYVYAMSLILTLSSSFLSSSLWSLKEDTLLETFKASKIRWVIWVITDSDVKHILQGREHISLCKRLHLGLPAHSRFLQLHQPVIRPEPVTTTSATKINIDDNSLGDTII